MDQYDLLRLAAQALESLKIKYATVGSMASMFHGEPRYTNDVDILVALPLSKVGPFCAAFPEDEFYVSVEAARDAVIHRSQFNVIHPTSGLKVDIMIAGDSELDQSRLARAVRVRPREDFEANFASPEDVILKKMEYYRDGGSEKHLRDITGILKISGDEVDLSYIQEWAARLGVSDIWQAVVRRVDKTK